MRLFSLAEAEQLIPQLEKIFDQIAELAAQAQVKANQVRKLEEQNDAAQLAMTRSQVQFVTGQIEAKLQSILDLGAVPKGLEPALVDFPAKVDGEEVFLCWKLGEKKITAYHGVDEGYANRKPL